MERPYKKLDLYDLPNTNYELRLFSNYELRFTNYEINIDRWYAVCFYL